MTTYSTRPTSARAGAPDPGPGSAPSTGRDGQEIGDGGPGGVLVHPTPRWPSIVGLAIIALGILDAADLTYAHFTSAAALSCPDTGAINCAKVTTSSYSHLFGLPVAVLGLAFFVGMVPLNLPAAWRSQWRPLRLARLGATAVGVVTICWLIYAELFRIHAICLYCTGVHLLTLALFIATVVGTISTATYEDEPRA